MIALAAEGLAVQPASGPSATAEVNPPSPVDVDALEYVGEMPSEVIWEEEDVMELTAEGLADDEEKRAKGGAVWMVLARGLADGSRGRRLQKLQAPIPIGPPFTPKTQPNHWREKERLGIWKQRLILADW